MAVVGRVVRSHGLRGQVVVNLETDFPEERFRPGAELFVERGGVIKPLTLTSVRFQNQRPVIGIAGVDTIDAAEPLAGLELRVPADRLAPLPAGTFYRHDLVGVTAGDGDVLIPLASEICPTIDVAGKRIVIEPPDGLLDLNK